MKAVFGGGKDRTHRATLMTATGPGNLYTDKTGAPFWLREEPRPGRGKPVFFVREAPEPGENLQGEIPF